MGRFSVGPLSHYGVYVGDGLFVHNHPKRGVRVVDLPRFSRSGQVYLAYRPPDPQIVTQRALGRVGKPYDLLSYNCEHFVSDVVDGVPESAQLEMALWGLGALALASLL